MEKEEEKVIDQNTEPAVEDNDVVLNPEEETLAQTDEVIPAPAEPVNPDIPVDTIPASTSIPLTVDEMPAEEPVPDPVVEEPIPEQPVDDAPLADIAPPMADIPVDSPVEEPPVVEMPVDQVTEPSSVEVAPDAPIEEPTVGPAPAPIDAPVEEPIPSDVVPEVGDESPADVAVPGECPNCEGEGCPVCDSTSVANLFGTMQEAVTIIWKYHLRTRKFSVHLALNDFYHAMIHLVDDLIEQYQGLHGVIDDVCSNCVWADGTTEYEYLNNLRAYIENNRGLAGTDSEIQSAIDDILGLIDTTLYKLNNLTESNVKSFEEFVYEDYCCDNDDEDTDEEKDPEEE